MNTFTFIASLFFTLTAFSPLALGKQTDFPIYAAKAKHCELENKADHQVARQQVPAIGRPSSKVRSANGNLESENNS